MKNSTIKWLWIISAAVFFLCLNSLYAQETYKDIEAIQPIRLTRDLGKRTETTGTTREKKTRIVNTSKRGIKIQARITAFSAHEFCASSYARITYPNCNGNTFPKDSAAVNSTWIKQGYTSIYIPKYATTYRIIGHTDSHTDVDLWQGSNYQSALDIGNEINEIQLIKE